MEDEIMEVGECIKNPHPKCQYCNEYLEVDSEEGRNYKWICLRCRAEFKMVGKR